MSIRIGFIISPPLEAFFQNILARLKDECSCRIYAADEPYQAYQLYKQHIDEVDFFILSGKMFLYTISSREDVYQKPCFALDGAATNIKDILLELLLNNRSIDLSRVFIDVSNSDYHYLGLKELLPADQQPLFLDMSVPELEHAKRSIFGQETLESFMEYVYQTHVRLHKENIIDLSVTRFGTLIPHFNHLGIPYRYIYPDSGYVHGFILERLQDHRESQYYREEVGAVVVSFVHLADADKQSLIPQIETILRNYSNYHDLECSITSTENNLEIILPVKALYDLTNKLQDLSIIELLLQAIDDPAIHFGIGLGKTITAAKYNAYTAAEVGKGSTRHIYCVAEDGKITGPLGDYPTTITNAPDQQIRQLAEQLDVDHRSLQKIITFAKICNTKTVTSEDISRYLQITRRSGNRILNKIVSNGGAIIFKENMNGGKGRPKNYYKLLFLEKLKE